MSILLSHVSRYFIKIGDSSFFRHIYENVNSEQFFRLGLTEEICYFRTPLSQQSAKKIFLLFFTKIKILGVFESTESDFEDMKQLDLEISILNVPPTSWWKNNCREITFRGRLGAEKNEPSGLVSKKNEEIYK